MSERPAPAVKKPGRRTLDVYGQKTMRRLGIEVISENCDVCPLCENRITHVSLFYRKEPRVRMFLIVSILALLALGAYTVHAHAERGAANNFHDKFPEGN